MTQRDPGDRADRRPRHICLVGFHVCNDCLTIGLLKEQFTVTLVEALGDVLTDRARGSARLGSLLYSADLLVLDCVPRSGEPPSRRSVGQVLGFLEYVASRFAGLEVVLVDRAPEGDVERRARFFEAGVREYVTYPYGGAELVKIVGKYTRTAAG